MLHVWPKGQVGSAERYVCLCGSWRCDHCMRWKAATDFARMKEAFGPYASSDVVLAVLTLDQDGTFTGERWADAAAAYRALSDMSRRFLKRINRWLRREGLGPVGSRWVATVEAHRSNWPHLNIVMVSRDLARLLESQATALASTGATHRETILVRGEVLHHVLGAGWGPQSTMEQARDKDALASYLVKLAGELDDAFAALGEVCKMTQVPRQAPKGTRRLRSGRGFLPPRRRDPLMTGALLLRWDGPGGVCTKVYGRGRMMTDGWGRPSAWAPTITRLPVAERGAAVRTFSRRQSDLRAVVAGEARATTIPLPRVLRRTHEQSNDSRARPPP